ncbi:MAG: hypothetical protein HQM10_09530 [Candidatus Riflebacteria bacterium]|nr:hypothetical protein [Candidatus Riflebacteria bacterium]
MKARKLCGLLLAVIILFSAESSAEKNPFSDKTIAISPTVVSTARDSKDTGFWDSFIKNARSIYSKFSIILNKAFTNDTLPVFVSKSAIIPGHDTHEFVCQGVCYLPDDVISPAADQIKLTSYKHVLLSYYSVSGKTDEPSQLVVVDINSGKPLRRFGLYESEGQPYTGHAGGVTVAGAYVWVASGFRLYGFKLREILDFMNDSTAKVSSEYTDISASLRIPSTDLVVDRIFDVDSKASFVSFDGIHLWVGDFVKSSSDDFAPVKHHAKNPFDMKTWIAGYKVNDQGLPTASQKYNYRDGNTTRTAFKPDRLIFCRESVQGMAICGKYAALSISYGARNSKLAFYRSPLNQPSTSISFTPAGHIKTFTTEGWVLAEGINWLKTINLPAGAEDLEYDGSFLYVTFEGASPNYRQKWISMNPSISISEKFYLINPSDVLK